MKIPRFSWALLLLLGACSFRRDNAPAWLAFDGDPRLLVETTPMAAGGARATLDYGLDFFRARPTYTAADSSNSQVATVSVNDTTGMVDVVSGAPGTTVISVLDPKGAVLQSATLTVRAVGQLVPDFPFGANGITVLTGSQHVLHLTPKDGAVVLIGEGEVQFTADGGISPLGSSPGGQGIHRIGDTWPFQVMGPGTIHADSTGVHLTLPVSAADHVDAITVAPASLNFALKDDWRAMNTVTVTALAALEPLRGAYCEWTLPDGLVVNWVVDSSVNPEYGPSLLLAQSMTYQFTGDPGTYIATCTMGGVSARLPVIITP